MSFKLIDFVALLSGFRKFTIMMLLIIVGSTFRVMGYINGLEFVDLLKGAAVAFFAINGIEHMTGAVQEWIKTKRPEK